MPFFDGMPSKKGIKVNSQYLGQGVGESGLSALKGVRAGVRYQDSGMRRAMAERII